MAFRIVILKRCEFVLAMSEWLRAENLVTNAYTYIARVARNEAWREEEDRQRQYMQPTE